MILALETGGDLASLALIDGSVVVAERAFRHRMSLSRDLLPAIDTLLTDAEVRLSAVDAVAVGLGPGSYTGLRIGLVTAKTLAWAMDRPILGVSSLAALVAPCVATIDTLLCAVLEAREGEFFTALYQRRDHSLQIRAEPTVLRTPELAGRLASYPGPVLVTGHAARFLQQAALGDAERLSGADTETGVPARLGTVASGAGPVAALSIDEEPQARWIGRLAADRLNAGERDDPVTLAPLYVRAPSPTLKPTMAAHAAAPAEMPRTKAPRPTIVSEGACPD
jgi:tRNA threonylcarbamoyladenosine biosynthesis protein TsaB